MRCLRSAPWHAHAKGPIDSASICPLGSKVTSRGLSTINGSAVTDLSRIWGLFESFRWETNYSMFSLKKGVGPSGQSWHGACTTEHDTRETGVTDKMLAPAGWSNRSLTSKTPRGSRCFGVETSRPRTDAAGRGVVACNGSRETGRGIGPPGDRWSIGGKAASWRGTKPREVTGLAHRQR